MLIISGLTEGVKKFYSVKITAGEQYIRGEMKTGKLIAEQPQAGMISFHES
jgi:hypothetical protein